MAAPTEQLGSPGLNYTEEDPVLTQARELRSQWLDERLNPDGSLPYVGISEDGSVLDSGMPDATMKSYKAYGDDFEQVGNFYLTTQLDPDNPGRTVDHMSWLETSKPGQGYGKAMYLDVLKTLPDSATLVSDKALKPGSYRIWEWLESKQLAVRNEGQINIPDPRDENASTTNEHDTSIFRSTVPGPQAFNN